jgi:hypothetical protein
MWSELKIEVELRASLRKQFGDARGEEIFADYISARACLTTQIIPFIVRAEPNLSDHGVDHIENVLTNIFDLLGDELNQVSGIDLYSLCVATLFHDVGNLFGREDHQKKITEIYQHVRPDQRFSQEKAIIMRLAGAHTGHARDGTKDTLRDVSEGILYGKKVETQALAALLRLADELAEGQQRTSDFIFKMHGYSVESEIFHEYATMTSICIDRGGGRIMLTYNVEVPVENDHVRSDAEVSFKKLIEFAYHRAVKLDQERRYTKFHCPYLTPLKSTDIQFNFHVGHELHELDLRPIILSDKTIPGETGPAITDKDPAYAPDTIWAKLLGLRIETHSLQPGPTN